MELHTRLKNQLVDLQTEIDEFAETAQSDINRLTRERARIEKEEPSISRWLNVVCYNEAVDALDYGQDSKKVAPFYYYLGNLRPY